MTTHMAWLFVMMINLAVARAETAPAELPKSIEECYLRIALTKTSADMAYVAREICNAAFTPKRQSLFVLDTASGACTEWWFDPRGRYESASLFCALESTGGGGWTLACQHKDKAARFTLVSLVERGDVLERSGELQGVDPGALFRTMGACLRHKAKNGNGRS